MKVVKGIALLAIVLLFAAQAAAESRVPVYLSGKLGASFMTADGIKNTTDGSNLDVHKSEEDDTLFVGGAAVGYDFGKTTEVPVRLEMEYMYRSDFSFDAEPAFVGAGIPNKGSLDMSVQTLLFNAYVDIPTGTAFTPYVGGGIGWAFLNSEGTITDLSTGDSASHDNDETNAAWNIGGGVAYEINTNWTADLGYRYLDVGDMEWGESEFVSVKPDDITTHEVVLGIRYTF